jgi:AraC-like DNA-binding protein
LRHQLQALLVRLYLAQTHREQTGRVDSVALQRFKRYRLAVEQEFPRRHKVAHYAKRLGCSEKSLGRAALEIAGVNAKKILIQRIVLEAKRLLAHTILPISAIADKLGFDEATNFVKFFRRQTGGSPGAFRKLHARR